MEYDVKNTGFGNLTFEICVFIVGAYGSNTYFYFIQPRNNILYTYHVIVYGIYIYSI